MLPPISANEASYVNIILLEHNWNTSLNKSSVWRIYGNTITKTSVICELIAALLSNIDIYRLKISTVHKSYGFVNSAAYIICHTVGLLSELI